MLRLEVIDYFDSSNQSVVARVPESGSAAIQFGAQLIVQQNQRAVFFRDGKAMDQFGPGRYTLTTNNIPIIGGLLSIPFEKSPFQAQVYFVGMQTFVDQRWGTRQPITIRDRDFGIVRLRSFGKFAFRVADPALLINMLVGTQGKLTTEEIVDYLRDNVVTGLSEIFANANIPLLDMPGKLSQLSSIARVKLADQFQQMGLELTQLTINSVSPPEEVQRAIDAKSGMAVLGDLRSFTVYQTANGIAAAGQNGGGAGGMGMGIGLALPSILQQALANNNQASAAGLPFPAANAGNLTNTLAANPTAKQTPKELVRQIASQAKYEIQDLGDELLVTVPVGALRRQVVHVDTSTEDHQGFPITKVWSACGVVTPNVAMTLLRSNNQLIYGSFAIQQQGDSGEKLVIQANMLSEAIDTVELARCISSIAFQADQYESQISGDDAF